MTDSSKSPIQTLASLVGIEAEYHDIWGRSIQVETETLVALLQAMGYRDLSAGAVQQAVEHIQASREFPFPPVITTRTGKIHFRFPPQWRKGEITIRGEAGEEMSFRWQDDEALVFDMPADFPHGYYQATGTIGTPGEEAPVSTLIVHAPAQCFSPPEPAVWGTTMALYSLQSSTSQGIGDLADLDRTLQILEDHGAGFVGLLPLHLIENTAPYGISPYYPLDRMLWNPIYLNLDQVARFSDWTSSFSGIDGDPFSPGNDASELIEYQAVWKAKQDSLRRIFQRFYQTERQSSSARWEAFQSFLNGEGERGWMTSFFNAYRELNETSWQNWPLPFRNADRAAIRKWIDQNEPGGLFQSWLQWMMEHFLRDAAQAHNLLGFDLPIGSSPEGSECWLEQDLFAAGARVGAPPDDFSPQGQNWGFLPVNPFSARQNHYRHFRALLQKNLRFCRFLRIDHIMGLYRSYWIPEGAGADQGTYVRHFSEELFAILALESERHGVTVIGEDLGTVPPRVRELMTETGVLSTRVFYFERDQSNLPPPPDHYPARAFITLNTHDMPTLKGYCTGLDLEIRRELGIFDQEVFSQRYEERNDFLRNTLARFSDWGLLPGPVDRADCSSLLFEALLRYLAATSCHVKVVSLEDILELSLQPNLPSTLIPGNWRHRVPIDQPPRPDGHPSKGGELDFEKQVKKVNEFFQG